MNFLHEFVNILVGGIVELKFILKSLFKKLLNECSIYYFGKCYY